MHGDKAFSLREHRPGDLGLIIHHQAALYHREYGWDITFEALLAEISAAFIRNFDPTREGCWVAERDGAMLGSVTITAQDAETARLRMLFVLKEARGIGLGGALVDHAVAFSRAKGYKRVVLWTQDILTAAVQLYTSRGFVLTSATPNEAFGQRFVSQTYELAL